jgi:transposase-like protein
MTDAPEKGEKAQFEAAEEKAVREQYAKEGHAECPRCNVRMNERSIGGGSFGLGYARQREWLLCPNCRRSVLFDLKRGTRN